MMMLIAVQGRNIPFMYRIYAKLLPHLRVLVGTLVHTLAVLHQLGLYTHLTET